MRLRKTFTSPCTCSRGLSSTGTSRREACCTTTRTSSSSFRGCGKPATTRTWWCTPNRTPRNSLVWTPRRRVRWNSRAVPVPRVGVAMAPRRRTPAADQTRRRTERKAGAGSRNSRRRTERKAGAGSGNSRRRRNLSRRRMLSTVKGSSPPRGSRHRSTTAGFARIPWR